MDLRPGSTCTWLSRMTSLHNHRATHDVIDNNVNFPTFCNDCSRKCEVSLSTCITAFGLVILVQMLQSLPTTT